MRRCIELTQLRVDQRRARGTDWRLAVPWRSWCGGTSHALPMKFGPRGMTGKRIGDSAMILPMRVRGWRLQSWLGSRRRILWV